MATEQEQVERPPDFRKDVKISPETNTRLELLMQALGIKTKTQALDVLLNRFGEQNTELVEGKIATIQNVLVEPAPVCIYGKPGAGKSFTVRKLVLAASAQGMNVILVDVANEYATPEDPADPFKRKTKASAAAGKRFGKGLYRIVLDKAPEYRQLSIQRLFEHLNVLAFKKKLLDFFVAIDEGNEFVEINEIRNFLTESRKFVRKAVVVSADPEPYRAICTPMKPLPRI